jgi:hypothetical protein
MSDEKRKRFQYTKAEKRVLAEETTRIAMDDELERKRQRDAKTARLRILRLDKNTPALPGTAGNQQ